MNPEILNYWSFGVTLLIITFFPRISFKGRIPTLVIVNFENDPAEWHPALLEISGYPAGFLSWILIRIGILSEKTEFVLTRDEISLESKSIFGVQKENIQLQSITSAECNYTKPIWLLVIFVFLFVLMCIESYPSLRGMPPRNELTIIYIITVYLSIISLSAYFHFKRISIFFKSIEGKIIEFSFRRREIQQISITKLLTDTVEEEHSPAKIKSDVDTFLLNPEWSPYSRTIKADEKFAQKIIQLVNKATHEK